MNELWSPSAEVVAWTDHDGPSRPPAGPSSRWYVGLAVGFAAWFLLAIVGCEVIHHSGSEHVPLSMAEVLGGTAVFLGLPAMAVLLARRNVAGAWLAAILGSLAAAVSMTQWSLAPRYTAIEAGGFAILAAAGLLLGILQLRSRFAPAGPVPSHGGPPAASREPASAAR